MSPIPSESCLKFLQQSRYIKLFNYIHRKMLSDVDVYVGSWIDYTKGPILGATLTLTYRDGAFMVAFLALFVRMAGSHLCGIFCYITHQWRSNRRSYDVLHHQQQAKLRKSSSVSNALWLWLKIGWSWRSNTRYSFWRSLILISAAIVHIATFGITGVFSSHVKKTSTNALVTERQLRMLALAVAEWPRDRSKSNYESNVPMSRFFCKC